VPPKTLLILHAASLIAFAQAHSYTQSEIEEGIRRYRISCIGCHGGDGASVTGVDLARGKFRRVSSDEEIVDVIVNGIPGTAMPPTQIPPIRAYAIVAFLRNMNSPNGAKSIAAARGDEKRGKALFDGKGGCVQCHRIGGFGGRSGPDLSEAGLVLRPIEIETAMLDPDADYLLFAKPFRVVTKDGGVAAGLLLNQDTFSVQILDSKGDLRSYSKSELREFGPSKSPMPSYRGKIDPQELADIVAYIGAQRGAQ